MTKETEKRGREQNEKKKGETVRVEGERSETVGEEMERAE